MKLSAKLICLALVACALVHSSSGFVVPVRSIKHCINIQAATVDTCNNTCLAQLPNDWNSPLQTKFIAKFEFSEDRSKQCCCRYDDSWNIPEEDDWRRIVSGIHENFRTRLMGDKHTCSQSLSSRLGKIGLSKPSKEENNYQTMCNYMQITRPLTMLEIAELIRSGSSLNSRSLSNKERLNIQHNLTYTPQIRQLFESNLDLLLDHKRDHTSNGDPRELPFEVEQIKKLVEVANRLKTATKYLYTLHRSLDELIVSRVMVSILEAKDTMDEINETIPDDSFESLLDMNPEAANKVYVDNFSCEKFINASNDLTGLLQTSKSALDSLSAKKGFEEMSKEWAPMQTLQKSITVYDQLIRARCESSEDEEENSD